MELYLLNNQKELRSEDEFVEPEAPNWYYKMSENNRSLGVPTRFTRGCHEIHGYFYKPEWVKKLIPVA